MDIATLFESKTKSLFWRALDAAHLIGVPPPRNVDPGKAYFQIRLCEMYLGAARKLWHQIYPMLHCFVQCGPTAGHAIASPAQLRELGDANLDRIANLNVRLCPLTPYNGEEISLLAGLYAIPGHDAAKALIDVVGSFSTFDPTDIGRAAALSGLIKNGVDSILGLDQATLQLGVRDSFSPGSHPLRSGYYAGIGAAPQDIDLSQIWVLNGRLVKGKDASTAVPYTDHDYLLLSIECMDKRDDWQQLADLQSYRKKLGSILGDPQFTAAEKRSRLAALWPGFVQMLADCADLIDSDRDRIAALIADELIRKLKSQEEANPFLRAA